MEIKYEGVYTTPSMKGYVLAIGTCWRSQIPRGAAFHNAETPQVYDVYINQDRAASFVISMRPSRVNPANVCLPPTILRIPTDAEICYAIYFGTRSLPKIALCVYVGCAFDPVTWSYKTVRRSITGSLTVSNYRESPVYVGNFTFKAHPLPEPPALTPVNPSPVLTPVNTPPTSPPPLKTLHTNDSPIREPPRLRYPHRAFCFYPNTPTTSETSESDPGSPAVRELKATIESAQHNVVTLLNGLEQRLTERMDALEQKLETTQAK